MSRIAKLTERCEPEMRVGSPRETLLGVAAVLRGSCLHVKMGSRDPIDWALNVFA